MIGAPVVRSTPARRGRRRRRRGGAFDLLQALRQPLPRRSLAVVGELYAILLTAERRAAGDLLNELSCGDALAAGGLVFAVELVSGLGAAVRRPVADERDAGLAGDPVDQSRDLLLLAQRHRGCARHSAGLPHIEDGEVV